MEGKQSVKQILGDYLLITAGIAFVAAGVYFFKFPNRFSTGGVSGISVILGHYFPSFTAGDFVAIINMVLLLFGFFVFGRSFGFRTAYASILMSAIIWVLERVLPMSSPMTTQPFLELIFAVTLPAVGSAILFNINASSGGTDIVAMILKKYTHLNIGNALMLSDSVITLAACVAFGMETGLFSVLGLIIKCLVVDMVMENIKTSKCFQIVTTKPQEIEEYIIGKLNRSATVIPAEGAYSHENRTVLLTAVSRAQAVRLRAYCKQVDPHSFTLITNSTEIIGKGFRGTN